MNFYIYYLLILINANGQFVVGEFGGPLKGDKTTYGLAKSNCESMVQNSPRSESYAFICVEGTPENVKRYRGTTTEVPPPPAVKKQEL
jgi:hypothetical protein